MSGHETWRPGDGIAFTTIWVTTDPDRPGWRSQSRARGAEVLFDPLHTYQPGDLAELTQAVRDLRSGRYGWLVLTSVRAVQALLAVAGEVRLAQVRARVAAVGPSTAAAAREAGLTVTLVPEQASASGLLRSWPLEDDAGEVLLPLSDLAPSTLEAGLGAFGARPHRLTAYRVVAADPWPETEAALRAGRVHAVVVTSGSAARRLAELAAQGLPLPPVRMALGEPTAQVAAEVGLAIHGTASQPTPAAALLELAALLDEHVPRTTEGAR